MQGTESNRNRWVYYFVLFAFVAWLLDFYTTYYCLEAGFWETNIYYNPAVSLGVYVGFTWVLATVSKRIKNRFWFVPNLIYFVFIFSGGFSNLFGYWFSGLEVMTFA